MIEHSGCDTVVMDDLRIPSGLLPADTRFGSGPSRIRTEVLQSLSAPDSVMGTSHRQAPVKHIVAAIREGLAELYRAPDGYEIALGNGGASLFWDAASVCLVDHRAATGVFGEFGHKFATALHRAPFLADPAVFEADPGQLAVPTAVPGVDAYCWPHNETSTGVVAPVRRPDDVDDDALVLIDATSAAGGVDADLSQTDAYYFSPQKNLASDGGLWLSFLSPRAIERAERLTASARWVPAILDLSVALTNSRSDQTLNTPALATLVMARAQIEWVLAQGGMAWVGQRTHASSGLLYRWAEDHPLAMPFVTDPTLRSPVVVTIDLDPSVDAARLCQVARDNGIVDIEGYRKLGRNQIRVGTFAAVDPADVEALVGCLDWIIERIVDPTARP